MTTRARRTPAASARRFPVVPLALGIIVLLGVAAVVASRGSDDSPAGTEQFRTVSVTGTALPPLPDGAADPAIGTAAPVVRGESFSGEALSVGGSGTPQLIAFVAHWCEHCQKEVPVVTEWLAQGAPDGVTMKAVSTSAASNRPNYPPSEWLADEDWPVPTIADDPDNAAAQAFGVNAFPYFVALDADGKVVARVSGELTIPQLEALVDAARS